MPGFVDLTNGKVTLRDLAAGPDRVTQFADGLKEDGALRGVEAILDAAPLVRRDDGRPRALLAVSIRRCT